MRGERGAAPRCHGRFLQIQVFHSESRRLAAMHRAAGCKDDGASVAFRDPGLCGADREGLPGSPADGYDSPLSLPGVGLPLGYRVRKAVSLKPVYVPRMAISIPSSFCGRTSHWPGSQCSRPCDSRQHPANPVLPKLLEKLHTVQRSVCLAGSREKVSESAQGAGIRRENILLVPMQDRPPFKCFEPILHEMQVRIRTLMHGHAEAEM